MITKGVGGAYSVKTADAVFTCTARGIFRNRNQSPLVGDHVVIDVTDAEKKIATLHTIKPRENELRRPPAANITQVIITVATTQPAFNAGLLDRFLVMAEYENIPILICVNKVDLNAATNDSFEGWGLGKETFPKVSFPKVFKIYESAGYPLVYAAATDGTGLDDLRESMASKVNLFAGPSGVGKSSLINALMPGVGLETGDLSAKLGRGKHTTRHTEIFPLGETDACGFCFDTPGFTSLDIEHIKSSELAPLFREFRPLIGGCKFNNCMHIKENDCAVKAQVGAAIHPARYESYVKLASL